MLADDLDTFARTARRRRVYVPAAEHRVDYGRADVERLVPHREPFLFVDRVDAVDREAGFIEGRLALDPADPIYRGHFPGDPVFPGCLQLEAIGQLALCLLALQRGDTTPRGVRTIRVHHAVFLETVRPGREVTLIARAIDAGDYTSVCAGQLVVGDTICCLAAMEVYFVEA